MISDCLYFYNSTFFLTIVFEAKNCYYFLSNIKSPNQYENEWKGVYIKDDVIVVAAIIVVGDVGVVDVVGVVAIVVDVVTAE